MRRPYYFIALCFLFTAGFAHPQDAPPPGDTPAAAEAAAPAPAGAADEKPEPPRSFRGISLGQDLEGLKTLLREDSAFQFREDRDVSLIPSAPDQTLVETQGRGFIRRAFFQLRAGAVFIMSFTLDTTLVDHYSVFTTLVRRYGEPTTLNPREAVWEYGATRVSLERPLTVKYIDKSVFDELMQGPASDGGRELLRRSEFLDGF